MPRIVQKLGDCRELYPARHDCVMVDPPYSKEVHDKATTSAKGGGYGSSHNDLGFAHLSSELRRFLACAIAAASKWSLVYSDSESAHLWIKEVQRAGGTYIRTIPWVRWSTPQKSGDRPVQGFEVLLIFWGSQKGSKRAHWHGPGNLIELSHECYWEDFCELRHKCMRGRNKHKTQKPLDQALDLMEWFSDPGDMIYSPCAGRGTFAMAARILGDRSVYEVEMDPREHRQAKARLRDPEISDPDRTRILRWAENRCKVDRLPPRRKIRRSEALFIPPP